MTESEMSVQSLKLAMINHILARQGNVSLGQLPEACVAIHMAREFKLTMRRRGRLVLGDAIVLGLVVDTFTEPTFPDTQLNRNILSRRLRLLRGHFPIRTG